MYICPNCGYRVYDLDHWVCSNCDTERFYKGANITSVKIFSSLNIKVPKERVRSKIQEYDKNWEFAKALGNKLVICLNKYDHSKKLTYYTDELQSIIIPFLSKASILTINWVYEFYHDEHTMDKVIGTKEQVMAYISEAAQKTIKSACYDISPHDIPDTLAMINNTFLETLAKYKGGT